jgi:hypothetical protein
MEESKTTKLILQQMHQKLSKIDADLTGIDEMPAEEQVQDQPSYQAGAGARVVPLSGLDRKLMQYLQIKEMACAEDVQKEMGYKGKNAACARLNKLYRMGIIERYQLGHRVYYKYDAGKATQNTLLISPPQ